MKRGSILLECMFALAIFIGAGVAIYSAVTRSVESVERTTRIERAADLARGAIAQISAGIAEPETLNGPVPEWRDERDGTFDESGAVSAWELEIETEPSQFDGLTLVRVRALLRDPPGGDHIAASFELAQLVRLSQVSAVPVEEDPLMEAARRGAAAEQRKQPAPARRGTRRGGGT